ncbi:Hypothetical protein, putative [Bodo saltans]|uniref:Uncharacterized protein n=1 Tax=Bodo saltans TaxID=75058 RepID=A0A0S4J4V3_BODSA|nr:Hypothetical protein, putative [Bodo saltans]|eukprot:CUG48225.1 Hypothetical protein, putative [Bodo saltans]
MDEEDPAHLPVCDQLITKWTCATRVGLAHLTCDALYLHLSCALDGREDDTKSVAQVLNSVCSNVASMIDVNLKVLGGRLERIDIPNFPSVYSDAFTAKDAEHDDAVCKKLAETLASAKSALGDVKHNALQKAVDCLSEKAPRTRNAVPPSAGNTSYTRLGVPERRDIISVSNQLTSL